MWPTPGTKEGILVIIALTWRKLRPELTRKGLRHGCEQSNEVESRYLQEKVTSLQVESTVYKFTL